MLSIPAEAHSMLLYRGSPLERWYTICMSADSYVGSLAGWVCIDLYWDARARCRCAESKV